jgi:hypothetical protein
MISFGNLIYTFHQTGNFYVFVLDLIVQIQNTFVLGVKLLKMKEVIWKLIGK